MLVDLHAQTRNTTSRGGDPARVPADRIAAAKKAGLDAIAFADRLHSSHARDLVAAGEEAGLPVFVGVEIPASVGRFIGFPKEIDPFLTREEWRQLMALPMAPTPARIIQLFEDNGGAVIAAQPYERENGIRLGDGLVFCDGLAGVEALTPAHSYADRSLAVEAGIKIGLPLAGSSASSGDPSRFATLLSTEATTQAEFVEALRNGNFWAVQLTEEERPKRSGRRRSKRSKRSGRSKRRRSGGRRRRRRSRGRRRSGGGKKS